MKRVSTYRTVLFPSLMSSAMAAYLLNPPSLRRATGQPSMLVGVDQKMYALEHY